MARRKIQNPEPCREGNWWYLRYWLYETEGGRRVGKRKRVRLAPANTPVEKVRETARDYLQPLNQGLITVGSGTTFATFVRNIYAETILPVLSASTRWRYESVLRKYLLPAFGPAALRDITTKVVQRYFSGMVNWELSHQSKHKIRTVLSSVMQAAVLYDNLTKNPVEGVRLPPSRSSARRAKPWVTPKQFEALVELMAEAYATMVFVAVHTGLRVSELLALRWRNVHSDSITIEERYCRGDWGPPKSEASNATIAVNPMVIQRIHRLKQITVLVSAGRAKRKYPAVRQDGPDDLVFQSPVKGGPMRDGNILRRQIKPAARKLGIGWVNWQVLRRSYATWLKLLGADVKDAQALLRHSRASTTLDIYQQFVPESQHRVVGRLSTLVQ